MGVNCIFPKLKPTFYICKRIFALRGFPGFPRDKEPACQCGRHKRHGFNPWVRKIPWSRVWQPTSVFMPGASCRQRTLVGYGPQCHKEWDTTEGLSTRTCICNKNIQSSRKEADHCLRSVFSFLFLVYLLFRKKERRRIEVQREGDSIL